MHNSRTFAMLVCPIIFGSIGLGIASLISGHPITWYTEMLAAVLGQSPLMCSLLMYSSIIGVAAIIESLVVRSKHDANCNLIATGRPGDS